MLNLITAPILLQAQAAPPSMLGPQLITMTLFWGILLIVPLWLILKKAGFQPALSLIIFIPLGTLVLIGILAFKDWSIKPSQN